MHGGGKERQIWSIISSKRTSCHVIRLFHWLCDLRRWTHFEKEHFLCMFKSFQEDIVTHWFILIEKRWKGQHRTQVQWISLFSRLHSSYPATTQHYRLNKQLEVSTSCLPHVSHMTETHTTRRCNLFFSNVIPGWACDVILILMSSTYETVWSRDFFLEERSQIWIMISAIAVLIYSFQVFIFQRISAWDSCLKFSYQRKGNINVMKTSISVTYF